jgi:hypothetical protein
VLVPTSELSQRRLSDAESVELGVLLAQMVDRYPAQDLSDSLEGYLWDFEQLALRYSLGEVRAALAEYRITPGAKFFPRPDEIASAIVEQRDKQALKRQRSREAAEQVRRNQEMWEWFDGRIRGDGQCRVNGQICRTDEDFLKASKTLEPRNFGANESDAEGHRTRVCEA